MSGGSTNRLGLAPSEGMKAPVTTAVVGNTTLSGLQTYALNDRVLLGNQTNTAENGIYNVKPDAWIRASDFNASDDVLNGQLVLAVDTGVIYQIAVSGTWIPETSTVTFGATAVLAAIAWGDLTGTLSDQTDLQTALDAKAGSSHTHLEADITDLAFYLENITDEPLSDLVDVTLTSLVTGQQIQWNGSAWVNVDPDDVIIQDAGSSLTTAVKKLNFVGDGVDLTEPVTDEILITIPGLSALPTGYIQGLVTAINDVDSDHDLDVGPGSARDATDVANLVNNGTITKRIDEDWVEGTGAGGFPSALTLAADTWYYVFLISDTTGGVDVGFDTSLSAGNLLADASSYSYYRRIGAVLTDGSSNLVAFTQRGRSFTWADPPIDFTDASPGTSAQNVALSVPEGVVVQAKVHASLINSSQVYGLITELTQDDNSPSASNFTITVDTGATISEMFQDLWTDTNRQIRVRSDTGSVTAFEIQTFGWLDQLSDATTSDINDRVGVFLQGSPVDTTSDTSIDVAGIPSEASKVTFTFNGVSLSGTEYMLRQLGSSGWIEETGYLGSSVRIAASYAAPANETTGFRIPVGAAGELLQGAIELTRHNVADSTWAVSGYLGASGAAVAFLTGGVKSLSGSLAQIRIKSQSTDTFDAGEINVTYDNSAIYVPEVLTDNSEYDPNYTFTYVNTTSWRIASTDATNLFRKGRRLRFVDGASEYFGTIASTAYSAGNTNITMTMEAGATLTNTISAVLITTNSAGWTVVPGNPLFGNRINAIATGQIGILQYWVLAGDNGVIFTSTDKGLSWVQRASGTTEDLLSAAYSPTLEEFMVTGTDGACTHTTNGTGWTFRPNLKSLLVSTGAGEAYCTWDPDTAYWFVVGKVAATAVRTCFSSDTISWTTGDSIVSSASNDTSLWGHPAHSPDTEDLLLSGSTRLLKAEGANDNIIGTVGDLYGGVTATAVISIEIGGTYYLFTGLESGSVYRRDTLNNDTDEVIDDVNLGSRIRDFAHAPVHNRLVLVGDACLIGYQDEGDSGTDDKWTFVASGFDPLADILGVAFNETDGIFIAFANNGQIGRSSNGTV